MKEIIAAVDFSECSVNAAEHALSIAAHAMTDLKLVYVFNKNQNQKTIFKYHDPIDEATQLLEELKGKFQPMLPENSVLYKIREGKVYKEVVTEANESNALMIVTGTHGSSGFEELWIGSNAYRIICSANCPVITLREGVKPERDLRRIVLPIDETLTTRQKVPHATFLASLFDAEIHVLALFQSSMKEIQDKVIKYAKQACAHLEKNKIKFLMTSVKCKNPTDATIEYATKVDANLIVIMTDQTTSFKNLFLGPYAEQMIHRSPIPVMSIRPKDLISVMSR
ncbi:MAG TPA: universal stress protein [Bacteroidales bacterium]|jgi:nucleotide-binding universal stress UspA family protein|nr:universal stress protein [Bacteroidales bacterium]MDI9573906.1 universal stress protein [Bacteroidota bacterium]OQC60944.1 MAG: universal stress protein UspE [Bacteroidetes bacterium ADurb.Bin012]MBP9512023.1 universal stress protein [Bacteroidales bacterium]MBP9588497.1 universal stress protein [Bacteroidales bacterium]